MTKAFRTLIVGMMLTSILAACGGGTANTDVGASTAPSTAASTAASVAASVAASAGPSVAASASAEASVAASASTAASAEPSTAAEASTEATGTAAAVELPELDPGELTGDIITAGSSTVFPLSQRMAEVFKDEGYTGNLTVDSIGSGAGFERFCTAGETDIANASREINDEEIAACAALSPARTPIEFRIGSDAVVIAVSSENDFLTELSLEQLGQVFSTANTWSEIDPSFPNEPIQRFIPGSDSGTFDFFADVVYAEEYDEDKQTAFAKLLSAQGVQSSEDDNILVQGIEGSPNAIGFFGYAYYNENKSRLKAISIEGVEPNEESAENGEYELSRPLFLYSDANILKEKPQVAAFINFYLSRVNDEILDVGYFPASDEALNEAKQAWLDANQ